MGVGRWPNEHLDVGAGIDIARVRFWFHSHATFATFWSGTDAHTIDTLATGEWLVSLVVNKAGSRLARAPVLAGTYAVFLKVIHKADFVQTPLPILAIVMFAVGIQFLLMGLLAEMLVRTYHESQEKSIYAVREKIGFPGA